MLASLERLQLEQIPLIQLHCVPPAVLREGKVFEWLRELRQEGLTDEQRQRIRERIREVRGEIQDARRDARRAEEELRYAEIEARAVRAAIGGRYGVW